MRDEGFYPCRMKPATFTMSCLQTVAKNSWFRRIDGYRQIKIAPDDIRSPVKQPWKHNFWWLALCVESDNGTAGPRYNAEAMSVHPSCDSLATVSVRVRVLSLLETTIHGRLPVADQSPFVLYNLGKDRESQVPVEELVVASRKVWRCVGDGSSEVSIIMCIYSEARKEFVASSASRWFFRCGRSNHMSPLWYWMNWNVCYHFATTQQSVFKMSPGSSYANGSGNQTPSSTLVDVMEDVPITMRLHLARLWRRAS